MDDYKQHNNRDQDRLLHCSRINSKRRRKLRRRRLAQDDDECPGSAAVSRQASDSCRCHAFNSASLPPISPKTHPTTSLLLSSAVLLLLLSCLPSAINAIQFPSSILNEGQSPSSSSTAVRSVSTPFGIVRGQLVSPMGAPTADGSLPPVVQFLAIPFGSAPTGHHRFKMAISAPKWTHQPKEAFRPPPACIQSGLPALSESEALKVTTAQRFDRLHRILPTLKPQSEDCLFMNLFVPERRDLRDAQPLSVLVLVHGDTDYGWGGANAYNGTLLAAFGRIVVVTLNYRLGVYGFLGRCDPEAMHTCAGNAGLSDLVAALKMLSLLLPSFGADPNAVTLLGWESGAALVSLLMASPITQPKGRLFRRAILLDGSALAPWAMSDSPQEQFTRLASELGCLGDGPSTAEGGGNGQAEVHQQKEATRVLHCLQDHGPLNLSSAARKVANNSPTFLSAFAPIIDGQMVPNHPSLSFSPKYGALFREIDLLLGTVQHPAQHLMADQDMQHGLGPERRDKMIRTLVRNIFDFHRSEILQAILNEYTDWENPRNHPKSIRNGLMAALGDLFFTAPLIETARAHSLDEGPQRMANTFLFVFGHETSAWMREQPNSGLRGSFTGDHLPYMLGHPLLVADGEGATQFSPEDKQLARVMLTFTANFVKSGDPTRPQPMSAQSSVEDRFQGLPWPQFSQQNREAYLEITDRPRVKNFYRNAFVQFWTGFVPVLNRRGGKDVPEEHHLLPDHFDRSSFFGQPRPFSTFHNLPFPPPPMPPTPFPKELRQQLIASLSPTTKRPPGSNGESTQRPSSAPNGGGEEQKRAEFNPSWGWLVLVGVALTVLNLCILAAISKQCLRRRSESKKKFQYQSYATPPGHIPPPPMDMAYAAMMSGQQSRRSSQYIPAPARPNSNPGAIAGQQHGRLGQHRQGAMDFGEELLDTDGIITMAQGAGMDDPNCGSNNNNSSRSDAGTALTTATIHRRRSSILSLTQQQMMPQGKRGSGPSTAIGERTAMLTTRLVGSTAFGGPPGQPIDIGNREEALMGLPDRKMASGRNAAGEGGGNNLPQVLGKRASLATSAGSAGGAQAMNGIGGVGGGGGHRASAASQLSQRSSLQEQQEPLLSAAGSVKGSTPSVVIQPPNAAGLIRLGTGISPTCPRHGRAAQMLLAANRGGGIGQQHQEQQQQQQTLEEVQV